MEEAPGHRGVCQDSPFLFCDQPHSISDELSFQLSVAYPRGGDKISLRASSARERHLWMNGIETASRKCKDAEKAVALKAV